MEQVKDQSYPVCTIRSKPEKLIHCIIWAKALFEGLFGPKDKSNEFVEDLVEQLELADISSDDKLPFAKTVFMKMFYEEVINTKSKLEMKEGSSLSKEEIEENLRYAA